MPDGRHTTRSFASRNSRGSSRAHYVRPIERRVYAQPLATDTVTPEHTSTTMRPTRTVNPDVRPAAPRQAKSVVLARHAIKRKPIKRVQKRKVQIKFSKIIVVVLVLFFGLTSFFGFEGWRNSQQHQIVLSRNTDEATRTEGVSEKSVSPEVIAGYEVEAELPRVLSISRLQITGRIKRIVAQSNGELTTPGNINDVGWYDGSVMPGEIGTALLVGHVFGKENPGVFNRINNVREGDTIQVERGDGEVVGFVVMSIEQISQEAFKLENALVSLDETKPSLHLLTHTGRYDVRTNKYENRILIRAIQK